MHLLVPEPRGLVWKTQVPAADGKTCRVSKGQCLARESLSLCQILHSRSYSFQGDIADLTLILTL